MIIKLLTYAGVSVIEVDNLRELKVVMEAGMGADAADARLAGLGHISDGHAWLDVDALRDAARPLAESTDWEREFRAMIHYASTMGWTDAGATSVRAHVESEHDSADRREEPGASHTSARRASEVAGYAKPRTDPLTHVRGHGNR